MNKVIIKYSIVTFAYLVVLCPIWLRLKDLNWAWDPTLLMLNIFPVFGLTAFTILWLHSMCGVFEPWLRKYINFDRFVHDTSLVVLVCIILHPLLLLVTMGFSFYKINDIYSALYVRLGVIGWLLLITYDIGKALKKYDFFVKNWNKILIISTIGFLLTFFHSLALGHELESGALRIIWIFYGVTAILGTIYTYGIKRLLR